LNREIPLVGIPVFGDQTLNMASAQSAGYAVLLSYSNITAESVSWALKEILENNRYLISKCFKYVLKCTKFISDLDFIMIHVIRVFIFKVPRKC
jgi:hypothetical protein